MDGEFLRVWAEHRKCNCCLLRALVCCPGCPLTCGVLPCWLALRDVEAELAVQVVIPKLNK